MAERPTNQAEMQIFREERAMIGRLRDAIGFCKEQLEINHTFAAKLSHEEKANFERCLVQNYLVKHGDDYFGKRDLIHLDLYSNSDIRNLNALAWKITIANAVRIVKNL